MAISGVLLFVWTSIGRCSHTVIINNNVIILFIYSVLVGHHRKIPDLFKYPFKISTYLQQSIAFRSLSELLQYTSSSRI